MKILTEKQLNKLLYEKQCETERRFHEIEDRRNLLDKIERLERRVSELDGKLNLPKTGCPVCVADTLSEEKYEAV